MLVRLVAASFHRLAALVESRFLVDLVRVAMKIFDVSCDLRSPGVGGTGANAVARVHRASTLRRKICPPSAPAGSRTFGQPLAMGVGAVQSAEISTVADSSAGDEEAHLIVLCESGTSPGQSQHSGRQKHDHLFAHRCLSPMVLAHKHWVLISKGDDVKTE